MACNCFRRISIERIFNSDSSAIVGVDLKGCRMNDSAALWTDSIFWRWLSKYNLGLQTEQQYSSLDQINDLYNVFKVESGRLENAANWQYDFLACMHICFMWSLKVNFSSMITPNILLAVTCLMVLLFILRLIFGVFFFPTEKNNFCFLYIYVYPPFVAAF